MLLDFLNTHENWQEILANAPYNIRITNKGEHWMLKYSQIDSDFNQAIVNECRGCVVRQFDGEWQYVCRPYTKFWNYGEPHAADIDWDNGVYVQEKVDGSLIKIWNDGFWYISTNGNISAYDAPLGNAIFDTFGDLVEYAICQEYESVGDMLDEMDEGLTYLFELVSPYNRVVVPYEKTELVRLGAINNKTGEEILVNKLSKFRRPDMYALTTWEEVEAATSKMTSNEEGFVIVDTHGNRVKAKSTAWLKAHYLVNNNIVTKARLLDVILDNEVGEFLAYCPEYSDAVMELKRKIQDAKNKAELCYAQISSHECPTRKDFAALVIKYAGQWAGFCFKNYNADVTIDEYTKDWTGAKWEKFI